MKESSLFLGSGILAVTALLYFFTGHPVNYHIYITGSVILFWMAMASI